MHLRGRLVGGHVGPHRADDAHVVDEVAEVREELADLQAALALLLELERRRERHAVQARQRLVGVLGEGRLGIPGVDVRRPAAGEDVDDMLGLGGEVHRVRGQARPLARPSRRRRRTPSGAQHALTEHRQQGHRPHAHARCRCNISRRVRMASSGRSVCSAGVVVGQSCHGSETSCGGLERVSACFYGRADMGLKSGGVSYRALPGSPVTSSPIRCY